MDKNKLKELCKKCGDDNIKIKYRFVEETEELIIKRDTEEYQEALDFLFDEAATEYEIDEDDGSLIITDCTNIDKYLNPRNKLQELVDKTSPKMSYILVDENNEPLNPRGVVMCGFCKVDIDVGDAFCRHCGHAVRSDK